jgi:hypothetical protein
MVFAVIRVAGQDLMIDRFLGRDGLEIGGVYRKGETRRNGQVHTKSGFAFSFPETSSWAQSLPIVFAHLHAEADLYREFRQLRAEVELDIGITVGEEGSFAPTLMFPNDFLSELALLGMDLNISAYPASLED